MEALSRKVVFDVYELGSGDRVEGVEIEIRRAGDQGFVPTSENLWYIGDRIEPASTTSMENGVAVVTLEKTMFCHGTCQTYL